MTYTHTGNCPRCGAPIFSFFAQPQQGAAIRYEDDIIARSEVPVAHFTCECRDTLPKALPEVPEGHVESVDDGDRKHLARNRPTKEPQSEEALSDAV